jgi:hypothetical protein
LLSHTDVEISNWNGYCCHYCPSCKEDKEEETKNEEEETNQWELVTTATLVQHCFEQKNKYNNKPASDHIERRILVDAQQSGQLKRGWLRQNFCKLNNIDKPKTYLCDTKK